jgi:hypothetical protein
MATRPAAPTRRAELEIPRADWRDVYPELIEEWEQGQHAILLGKTGSGKTTMALELIRRRVQLRGAFAVALVTKARDDTSKKTGWPIVRQWPPTYAQMQTHHVIFWPPYTRPSTAKATTTPAVRHLLDELMLEGGWTLFVDEMAYLVETLGLRTVLDEYWNGARSSGLSLIAGTQRPYWLSRSSVSQGDWVICFRINDEDDRSRAAQILGGKRYFDAIGSLGRHECLIVRTLNDRAVITELDKATVRELSRPSA